jgi:hypothetical protein
MVMRDPRLPRRKRGSPNRRRRLDGTIPGVRRLGNLAVPSRCPGTGGGSILNGFPLTRRCEEASVAEFFELLSEGQLYWIWTSPWSTSIGM